jgi:hypothetical protein
VAERHIDQDIPRAVIGELSTVLPV